MGEIEIKIMSDLEEHIKIQVSKIFVEGFYKDLSRLTKDVDKLTRVFENAFIEDACYVALLNNKAVGMICCSSIKTKAINIEKQKFLKELGFVKGSIAYAILKSEFNKSIEYTEKTIFIECMATGTESRGMGVGTALLQYIIDSLPYTEYILDVLDTNENAIGLYSKMGFKEFKRKQEKHGKQKGFNAHIYMRLLV